MLDNKERCSGGEAQICIDEHVKGGTSLIPSRRRRGSLEVEPSRTTTVITSTPFDGDGGGGKDTASTLSSTGIVLSNID